MKILMIMLAVMMGAAAARAELVSGQAAPKFKIDKVLNAPVSKVASMASLKGKVVYLDFWATWCPPCVASLPHMNKIVKALKGQPVVIIAVTDEPTDTIKEFLKTHEIDAWVGIDLEKYSLKAFNITGRPDGYLIGKDGKLLARITPSSLQEKDLRDAAAGKFSPRPVEQDEADARPAGEAKPFLEMNIAPASGKFKMSSGGGEFETRSVALSDTIAFIWDVEDGQVIVDTPSISALNVTLKTSPGNYYQGKELLKTAIQLSLGVKVTPERREADVYVLTLSTAAGAPRPKPAAPEARLALTSYGGGSMVGTAEMPEVARVLWMGMDKPVQDETGLKGGYELDMQWKYKDRAELEKLLAGQGLVLVPARRNVDFLHVTPVKI